MPLTRGTFRAPMCWLLGPLIVLTLLSSGLAGCKPKVMSQQGEGGEGKSGMGTMKNAPTTADFERAKAAADAKAGG